MNTIIDWLKSWNNSSTMWIWFLPSALLTIYLSIKLIKYAEGVIARTRFGGAFVGGVLVSISTSLPELITEITQGAAGTPAIGIADDIGANAFSTFMIAIVAIVGLKTMFIKKLHGWTKVMIAISLVFSLVFSLFLKFGTDISIGVVGSYAVGLVPIFFLLIYLVVVVLAYKFGGGDAHETEHVSDSMTAKIAIKGFIIVSIFLVGAALILNWVVNGISQVYSIPAKSAGGIFLSMTTAAPEMIALIIFYKNGQPSAAIASIVGSHIFNLSCIFYGDLAYANGPIIQAENVRSLWPISVMVTVMLTFLVILSVISTKIRRKSIYAIFPSAMIFTYIAGWSLILLL